MARPPLLPQPPCLQKRAQSSTRQGPGAATGPAFSGCLNSPPVLTHTHTSTCPPRPGPRGHVSPWVKLGPAPFACRLHPGFSRFLSVPSAHEFPPSLAAPSPSHPGPLPGPAAALWPMSLLGQQYCIISASVLPLVDLQFGWETSVFCLTLGAWPDPWVGAGGPRALALTPLCAVRAGCLMPPDGRQGVLLSTGPAGCLSLCMGLRVDARLPPWATS